MSWSASPSQLEPRPPLCPSTTSITSWQVHLPITSPFCPSVLKATADQPPSSPFQETGETRPEGENNYNSYTELKFSAIAVAEIIVTATDKPLLPKNKVSPCQSLLVIL